MSPLSSTDLQQQTQRRLDQSTCQRPGRGQSPAAHLLQPSPLCARTRIERFFNRIKHCRRTATRYGKLAANYLAFVRLASIRLWLTT